MPKIPINPHRLYMARKSRGWTQKMLAEKCGVAVVTIKKIEGRSIQPSIQLAIRLAVVLDESELWLESAFPCKYYSIVESISSLKSLK